MLSSIRLFALAYIGCLVTLGVAYAQQPTERESAPQSQTRSTSQLQSRSILDATLGDLSKMLADERATDELSIQRREGREIADLTAQQEMARWALWMVCLAGVAILVNAATVGLLWFTFRETRRATTAAKVNAEAALAAAAAAGLQAGLAKDALDATKKQMRAYVTVVEAKIQLTMSVQKPDGGGGYSFPEIT